MKFWDRKIVFCRFILGLTLTFLLLHVSTLLFADVEIIFDTQFDTNQINNEVHAIYKDGQDLYIGGAFTGVGGENLNYLAKRDSFAWTGIGDGVDEMINGAIYDIHKADENIYIGGNFTSVASNAFNKYLAEWNGVSRNNVGNISNIVYAVQEYNTDVYIGGIFSSPHNYISRYAGSRQTVGGGINGKVYAMDSYSGALYIAGDFTQTEGKTVNHIAKWNTSTWTGMGNGTNGTVHDIEITSNGEIYIGGDFTQADGKIVNNIAKWTGTGRTNLGSGLNGPVYHIQEGYNKDIYVGGTFTGIINDDSSIYLARRNGTAWNALSGLQQTTDGKINTMTKYDGDLYVGGKFKKQRSSNDHYFAKYYGEYLTYITGFQRTGRNNVTVDPTGAIINPLWATVQLDKGESYEVIVTYKNNLDRTTNNDTLEFLGGRKSKDVPPGEYGEFIFNIKPFYNSHGNWKIK